MDEARARRVARPGEDAEAHGHQDVGQLGRGEQRAEEGARVVREAPQEHEQLLVRVRVRVSVRVRVRVRARVRGRVPQEHEQLLLALEGHERAGEVGALRCEGVAQQPAEAAG